MTPKQTLFFFTYALIASSTHIVCMEEPTKFNPKNAKLVFDFHDVVVTEPFSCLSDLKKFFRWNLIPTCNRHLPWCIYELLACMFYDPAGEKLINIGKKYEQETFITCLMEVGNSFVVIEKTIDIMRELKNKGYQLDLASNIEIVFLNELERNNKYSYVQEILALFTHKKAVDHVAIYSKESIRKPDIRFFTEYQKEYNSDGKQVIFVDDKQKNIVASQQANMIGIHFQNPEQLRNELVKYGILEEQES